MYRGGGGRDTGKREAGRQSGTPRLSQQRPFRKGEFNPSETNTESHKIHQTNIWEGDPRGDKSMKQMVYFVMRHLTKIGSKWNSSFSSRQLKEKIRWGCGGKYSSSVGVLVLFCLVNKNELLSGFRMLNKKMLKLVHWSTANCRDQLDTPKNSGRI